MAASCPACGGALPADARFCPTCGRPVAAAGAEERKVATVLFADLADSTGLAQRLDAEPLRAVLGEVYAELAGAAVQYGGTVEKFIGDAVMAIFGVPVAHEDDPERAIRAARAMRGRLEALGHRRDLDLRLRIGINTGPVVAGTTAAPDFLVTGEAVNLAARLQQAASPGEILVGERTFRAVEPLVRTVAPRSLTVKGRSGPVTAYAVVSIAPASTYRRRRPHGPFVGRSGELALLRSLCERAAEYRRAHLVTVVGEPGIGKTRLAEELVIELQRADEPFDVFVGRCLPYGEGGTFAPLRELLLRAAAVRPDDSAEEARAKVEGELRAVVDGDGEEPVKQILRAVGLAAPEPDEREEAGSAAIRDAWRAALLGMAGRRPTLLVLEDAHWAEAALLDVVESLAAGGARAPLVVLCLAREELLAARPAWGAGARNATVVTLDALPDADMHRLALALAGGDAAAAAVARAGGNPFFLEEILAMHGEAAGDAIPDTIQGVIAARLDLLPAPEKRVLQLAATAGRQFRRDDLDAASGEPVPARLLERLAERDLVVPRGDALAFKHSLIRDVAYESLPRAERARIHLRLARWLEAAEGSSRQVVANHYATAVAMGASECRADAVRLLLDAAAEAQRVHAHGLALRQAELALTLAAGDGEQAQAYELVGDAHWVAENGDDAQAAYASALEHADRAGLDRATTARLCWKWVDIPTRWSTLLAGGPPAAEIEDVIERGLDDARAAGSRPLEARLLIAHALHVWRYERRSERLEAALESADRAAALAGEEGRTAALSAALDARVALLLALNRYRDAYDEGERRLALVPEISRREEQLDACALAAATRLLAGEYARALEAADMADGLSADGEAYWLGYPASGRAETFFWWDRWDDALTAYERALELHRRASRRQTASLARATAVAVAVHLLRGEIDRAELLEQRSAVVRARESLGSELILAHALLGRGEPELALDRLTPLDGRTNSSQPLVLAELAEAQALLERWDDLHETLRRAERGRGADELPRVVAQLDRARGIAGDGFALERATRAFAALGCRFEQARCLEIAGAAAPARRTFERLAAEPSLARMGVD